MGQVTVDHMHTFKRPAQGDRPLLEGILALRAFRILQHLMEGGLAHIQERIALQMNGGYFAQTVRGEQVWISELDHLAPLSGHPILNPPTPEPDRGV